MQINVKFFSLFRHYAGVNEAMVEAAPGASVTDLLDKLAEQFKNPAFNSDKTLLMLMVNNENACQETILKDGDVVLLMPILGGG